MPDWLEWTIFSSAILTGVLAIFAYFAILSEKKSLTNNYMSLKFIHFAIVMILVIFMVVNLILFDNLTGLGVSAYLDDNWPRIMKLVDMNQFEAGLTACAGGKYTANAPISTEFENFECPVN